MVAAQPDIVIPVANLLLQLGGAVVAAMPDRPAVDPVGAQRVDVANRAVPEALDRLHIAPLVAALRPGDNLQVLLPRRRRRRVHNPAAGAVHRHGFLHEHMLARRDGRLEIRRPETGRRGQNGILDIRHLQRLLEAVKAAETLVLGQAEVLHALPGGVGKDVRHARNFALHPGDSRFQNQPAPLPFGPMISVDHPRLWAWSTAGKLPRPPPRRPEPSSARTGGAKPPSKTRRDDQA